MLFISSCSDAYELIEKKKVQKAFVLNSSPTFNGYYYQGTHNNFHYFVSKWELEKDKYFKLRTTDLNIQFPYKYETKELRIDLIKTDRKFGNNDFYELFIVE